MCTSGAGPVSPNLSQGECPVIEVNFECRSCIFLTARRMLHDFADICRGIYDVCEVSAVLTSIQIKPSYIAVGL